MGKAKIFSKDLREKVVELDKTRKGYKKISKELRMPISSVQTLIRKWKMRDSVEIKPQSGRPRKKICHNCWENYSGCRENPQIYSANIQDSLKKVVWLFQDAQ